MERLKPASFADLREYFTLEIRSVIEKHQISAKETSIFYLASLLSRNIETEQFFKMGADGKPSDTLLTELYLQYLQAKDEEKRVILQRLGDLCLMVSGYFSESIRRKVVDIGFYFGMGGSAYYSLSTMVKEKEPKETFDELSNKFQSFSNVLGEMSERSGVQSNKDVLRLYERWIATGSDRLKNLLNEKGISAPFKVNLKVSQ
jgi:hypothetical protein